MLKSNIAWMKKNVPSDLKVWKGMIQDIDWSQVAAKAKLSLQRDKDRITAEFKEFAAMDTSAKIDWLMNGDRHLGYLYKKDAIAFARREWKGLKSVGYDFVGWLKIWGGMLNMVMKDPMSIMRPCSSTTGSLPTWPPRLWSTAACSAAAASCCRLTLICGSPLPTGPRI